VSSYLYYPGCSMDSSGRAYRDSIAAVAGPLGLDLAEIEDWNCCGATEYLGLSRTPAYALIARNLAIAEQAKPHMKSDTLVAPCSACFLNLSKADHVMGESPAFEKQVNEALAAGGMHYDAGSVKVRHLLDVIVHEIGIDAVKAKVTRPLAGLKLAPYLGCMVPRPDYDHRWENPEYPMEFDRLLAALGAEVVDFPLKTDCCGGHMTQISPPTAFEMIRRLVDTAARAGADMMVTLCPMCQMNIDAFQGEMNHHFKSSYHMPIVFFTQLIGLAFGAEPGSVGFGKEVVDARPALNRIGHVPEAPAEEAGPGHARVPRAKKPQGLPMPIMPGVSEVNR
jgi:heterodisulfide reductase subunit B2